MKKFIVVLLIIVVLASGCIRIKNADCPPNGDSLGGSLGVGAATSVIPVPDDSDLKEDVEVKETTDVWNIQLTEEEKLLPQKVVLEGDLVNFPNLEATDPDGDTITYTFGEPLDSKGEWLTKSGDAGKYVVSITASDGKNEVEQEVLILVRPANNAPVIDIDDIALQEGEILEFEPKVTDADGDDVEVTIQGWITEFPYTTTYDDAGSHFITVTATDGKEIVTKDVQVIIKDNNRFPEIEQIQDVVLKEFDELTLKPKVSDADGDAVTIGYSEPFDGTGTWQTKKGDAGVYPVTITASDGKDQTLIKFTITVESFNEPPILSGVNDITVEEGETVALGITAVDPEGEDVEITISGWMTSDTKEAGFGDAGEHEVLIEATDGVNTVKEVVRITVVEVNRPPVFGSGAFD